MAQGFTSLADVGKLPDAPVTPVQPKLSRKGSKLLKKKPSIGSISDVHVEAGKRHSTVYDDVGLRTKRTSLQTITNDAAIKHKKPTLMSKTMTNPGRMHLRELDPRRICQGSASTRIVMDWRKNRWEGTNRLIDRLLPAPRLVQYTMKLTGAARSSVVPEGNSEPSSEEEINSENSDDGAVVNSDKEDQEDSTPSDGTRSMSSSANNSTATGSWLPGGSCSGMSSSAVHMSRRRNKIKNKITGWLSQYSGCTKGHGERLMRKIYKPKCEEQKVKMNSGVRELLMTAPPCFCSLQAVNFKNFLIGNRGVQALWPLLRYARALKSLNLAGNDVHDSGLRHIMMVLEADAQNAGKDDVGGLLVVDFSQNPITGGMFEDLTRFNDTRKDVLMLGLADTMMPLVKRQRLLRQSLTKFAGAENHLSLEAWRLARDPMDFSDRELFIQCERIVEATHGSAIHDMHDMAERKKGRHLGWGGGSDTWNESDDDRELDEDDETKFIGAADGFLGLDDEIQTPLFGGRDPGGWDSSDQDGRQTSQTDHSIDAYSMTAQAPTDGGARDLESRLSDYQITSPTPPPSNPFADAGRRPGASGSSWAARRRKATLAGPQSALRETADMASQAKQDAMNKKKREDRMTVFHHD